MERYLEVCEAAARAGGAELLKWRGCVVPHEKSPRDFVTEADLASQRIIKKIILEQFPTHQFLGEETIEDNTAEQRADPRSDYCWIVDPLDGTMNFLYQLPSYSVSIGLRKGNQIIAGTVLEPVSGECFQATLGGGATLNGQPIKTNQCQAIEDALVVASFSSDIERRSKQVERFLKALGKARSVRRLGSAALNLCYVAAGRLDAYWATSLKIWDIAAGSLILQEAGGTIAHIEDRPLELDDPRFIASATPELWHSIYATFNDRN